MNKIKKEDYGKSDNHGPLLVGGNRSGCLNKTKLNMGEIQRVGENKNICPRYHDICDVYLSTVGREKHDSLRSIKLIKCTERMDAMEY